MFQISDIRQNLRFSRSNMLKKLFYNQTLKLKKELGSNLDVKIRFLKMCLDFALEPVY